MTAEKHIMPDGDYGPAGHFNPVRFTRSASRSHRRRHVRVRDVLVDLYTAALAAALAAVLAGSLMVYFREQLLLAAAAPGRTLADQRWLVLPQDLVLYGASAAALAAVAVLARRLGPVSIARAEGHWWLPLPLKRRPMVVRGILGRTLLTAGGGALLQLAVSFTARPGPGYPWTADRLAGAAAFGLAAAVMLLLAALRQTSSSGRSRPAAALILPAAAVLALLPEAAAAGYRWSPALAAAAAASLWLLLRNRLEHIPGAELVRGGAVSGHAGAAVYFMDVNELSRALAAPGKPSAAVRGRKFFHRPGAGPFAALLRADLVAFLRLPGVWVLPAASLLVCAVVILLEGGLPVYAQLAVIAAAGCASSSAVGAVARQTALLAGVDRLLPLPPAAVRGSRMLAPALAMAAWLALLGAGLSAVGAADPAIAGLGAAAGAGLGAAAVRGGYRQAPDWSVLPVDTPFGPVPSAQLGDLGRGLDTAFLALFPFLLAVFLGPSPALAGAQAAATACAVLVTLLSRR